MFNVLSLGKIYMAACLMSDANDFSMDLNELIISSFFTRICMVNCVMQGE